MEVEETTVKLEAGAPPNVTAVAPVKLVPVIVTVVRPAVLPEVGLMAVMVGTVGALKVNWSAELVADVPLGVTTVMSTIAAASAGEIAVMNVLDHSLNERAAVLPKLTAVVPEKLLPVMATTVPPVVLPLLGLTAMTDGKRAAL